jgi:hypothetical protein
LIIAALLLVTRKSTSRTIGFAVFWLALTRTLPLLPGG